MSVEDFHVCVLVHSQLPAHAPFHADAYDMFMFMSQEHQHENEHIRVKSMSRKLSIEIGMVRSHMKTSTLFVLVCVKVVPLISVN
jgi:hypothetical protein